MRITTPEPGTADTIVLDAIDLSAPNLYRHGDPHSIWDALRRRDPVHRSTTCDGRTYWSITRYADAIHALRDHATFTTERGVLLDGLGTDDPAGKRQIAVTDPPRHRLLRDPLHHALAISLHSNQQVIADHARRLRASWPHREPFDLAASLTSYPMAVLGTLMNLPETDWPQIAELTTVAVMPLDPDQLPEDRHALQRHAHITLFAHLQQALYHRKRDGGDDLITVLMNIEIDGHRLSPADVISNCYNLLLGANVTMPHAAATTLLHLIENGTYRNLADHPELLPSGIEEALRWSSPINHFLRHTTRDVKLGGTTIPAGDAVAIWLASANRDEDAFPDPYNFNIRRRPNKHLAFGLGAHYCVGHAVARLGLRALFEEIFQHVEAFELAGDVEHLPSNLVAGFRHLPVTAQWRSNGLMPSCSGLPS